MITVLCTHCGVRRHAPCAMVCKIETHSTDAQDKPIADGPALFVGRDFTVGERA